MARHSNQESIVQKPRMFVWSSEDQAVYDKWRRGLLIFYGCIGLVAAAVVTTRFTDIAVQFAGK
jgi:hypothetical protein